MTLTAAVADKIALILPRLASSHDGEVIASVKAIERTLKGAGADWHDLAATFSHGAAVIIIREKKAAEPRPEPAQHKSQSRSAPTWDSLMLSERVEWLTLCAEQAHLSPWEQEFVASILRRLGCDPYRPLTPNQKGVCDRLILNAFNFGYRP